MPFQTGQDPWVISRQCHVSVCQDTRVGFAPKAGGAAGWDIPPWKQQ